MSRGRAKLAFGQGLSVWLLDAPDGFGDAGLHAHHAIQITVCLHGDLSLTADGETLDGRAIAVAPDARHRFDAHGLLLFLFVEPESAAGRTLKARLFSNRPLVEIRDPAFFKTVATIGHALDDQLEPAQLLELGERAIDRLAPVKCLRAPDQRVQKIIAFANQHLDRPLTLESAAVGIFLSPSRLRHLFVEQTGLAFRTYLLWLRLVRAVDLYARGSSLTEAAHSAGFTDSAHFSRIFKRTFGLPATTLTRL